MIGASRSPRRKVGGGRGGDGRGPRTGSGGSPPPSAHGGRGWCMRREAAMVVLPPCTSSNNCSSPLCGLGFLHEHFWIWSSSLLCPQAVSSQPTVVPSLGSLPEPQVLAPSPNAPWRTPISGWGAQCHGTDHLCKSHSVLPDTDWLLGSPLRP